MQSENKMVPCSNIGTRKWVAKCFQMVSVVAMHISIQGNKHGFVQRLSSAETAHESFERSFILGFLIYLFFVYNRNMI